MKKGIINLKAVSFDIRKIIFFAKKYSTMIMLIALFSCGLIIGTVAVKNSEYLRYIISIFESNAYPANALLTVIFTLTVNFVMGLCLVGAPFIIMLSVSEGIGIGAVYSYRIFLSGYDNYGHFFLSEVLFYILLYVIFVCSQYSAVEMSESLKRYACDRKSMVSVRDYLIKFCVFSVTGLFLVVLKTFISAVL